MRVLCHFVSSFYEFLFYDRINGSRDIRRLSFFFSISQFLNSPLPFIWTNYMTIHLTVLINFIKLQYYTACCTPTTPIVCSNSLFTHRYMYKINLWELIVQRPEYFFFIAWAGMELAGIAEKSITDVRRRWNFLYIIASFISRFYYI